MKLDERALEDLIVAHLTQQQGYELGTPAQYNMQLALDTERVERFLRATQPQLVEQSGIFRNEVEKNKFFQRLSLELDKQGIVKVLRNGIRHSCWTFDLYHRLPVLHTPEEEQRYGENIFSVVRQLHFDTKRPGLAIDLAIFINGLPVMTLELKNKITGQSTADAVAQYKSNERDPKNILLRPKRCAVHFALDEDTIAMCSALKGKDSWFLPFNRGYEDGAGNPPNPTGLRTAYLWEEVLQPTRLSDILEHYAQVLVRKHKDPNGKIHTTEVCIWPRWHQFEVVRALLRTTSEGEMGQRFLIQHSAGSGKTNSITWLAYQLVALIRGAQPLFDSVIIVTDRVNLDKQLKNNVFAFGHSDSVAEWSDHSATLAQSLKSGKKIILTTVHKFGFILDTVGTQLSNRRFAVIIDEAHSSQSGKMGAQVNVALTGNAATTTDDMSEEDRINAAILAHMEGRRMAPNANFYAFTATPKAKTLETFGTAFVQDNGEVGHRPFHVYSMRQAIEEGFILDVLRNYTPYESFYHLRKAVEDDPEFDRSQALKKLHRFVQQHPNTIAEKAAVMVEHFHQTVAQKLGGRARAMICTSSVASAIAYFHEVNKLLAERNSPYKAVIAFSGEHEDGGKSVTEERLNGFPSNDIEKMMKEDPYRLLIVAEKFQTGYDEPLLHTMYVDKPLSGLQAVQTLSRLNRTCPGKLDTMVLDFANDADTIEKSFQTYYKTTLLAKETDPNRLNDLLSDIEEFHLYNDEEVEQLALLYWGENQDRAPIDGLLDTFRQRFVDINDEDRQAQCKGAMKAFVRTYEFLSTILPMSSLEWEKKGLLCHLLLPKLPMLKQEDLTRGLLAAVDFDQYRLVKREERNIQLQNNTTELPPVPTTSACGIVKEPEKVTVSELTKEFNTLFDEQGFTNPERTRQRIEEMKQRVAADDNLRDTLLNNDALTARSSCDAKAEQASMAMVKEDMEFFKAYKKDERFRTLFNEMLFEEMQRRFNPPYDERDLKAKIRENFAQDFADLCGSGGYLSFDALIDLFFWVVGAETTEDLQGLKPILQRTLNCLYRAEHREEDYRTWYGELVRRFEAFLKKLYALKHGAPLPKRENGYEPTFVDAVKEFPLLQALYRTTNEKFALFRDCYNVVYEWRNKESHVAPELPTELLPTALHAVVALYLYATLVSDIRR